MASYRALAVAQLMADDVQGYQTTCRNAFDRFSQLGPVTKAYLVRLLCLSADSGVSRARIAALVQGIDPSEVSPVTYGMAVEFYLFRMQWNEEVLSTCTARKIPFRDGCSLLFRSMANHRLGRTEEAKELLEQAILRIEQDYSSPEGQLVREETERWVNWGVLQILLREARDTLSTEVDAQTTLSKAQGVADTE